MNANNEWLCKLRIVSSGDGLQSLVLANGKPIEGVERVEISPIVPGQEVKAVITVSGVELGDYAGEIRKTESARKFSISNAPFVAVPTEAINARTP